MAKQKDTRPVIHTPFGDMTIIDLARHRIQAETKPGTEFTLGKITYHKARIRVTFTDDGIAEVSRDGTFLTTGFRVGTDKAIETFAYAVLPAFQDWYFEHPNEFVKADLARIDQEIAQAERDRDKHAEYVVRFSARIDELQASRQAVELQLLAQ